MPTDDDTILASAQRVGHVAKRVLFWTPLAGIALWVAVKVAAPGVYSDVIREDGLVETGQAITYLVSGLVALGIGLRFVRRNCRVLGVLYVAFSIGLLVACLEEISWGQRIFGIGVPVYFAAHNTQQELNVHNLSLFRSILWRAYVIVGSIGALSWIAVRGGVRRRYAEIVPWLVPGWYLTFFFLPVAIVYFYFGWANRFARPEFGLDAFRVGNFVVYGDQEPAELLLSLGFLAFVAVNAARQALPSLR